MKAILFTLAAATIAAQAAIVTSPSLGISTNIPIPTTFAGVSIDLTSGIVAGDPAPGAEVNFFFGGIGIEDQGSFRPVRVGSSISSAVANLAPGSTVSMASMYAAGVGGSGPDHIGPAVNQFQENASGYLGFQFNDGSGVKYGWMEVTLTANTAGGTVNRWAWEDSGSSIIVGAVPEASTSLIALLSSVLLLRRKR